MTTRSIFPLLPALFAALLFFSSAAFALKAEVRNHQGAPALFINGKPQVPMMFRGGFGFSKGWEERLASQVRLASQAGIHLYNAPIEMPWKDESGNADFSRPDRVFDTILGADPEALILPMVYIQTPRWWKEKYPEECMLFSDGKRDDASVASKVWQRDAADNLRACIRHAEAKYGDHIFGYHPCAQETAEWFYRRGWDPVCSGFEEPMRAAFADWAKEKYRNAAALRNAWGKPDADFASIRVPEAGERETATRGIFRDPRSERRIADFNAFLQEEMEGQLERMARIVKEETGHKKVTCFFYGYTFILSSLHGGLASSGHAALGKLLRCRDVDIVCSPIDYEDRQQGGSGSFMVPVDSVRRAGKLWLNEDDTRTHLTEVIPYSVRCSRAETPEITAWFHRRNLANVLARRMGTWYVDLNGTGWLDGKDIWDSIGALRGLYAEEMQTSAGPEPEVAVVVDEKGPFWAAGNTALFRPLYDGFRRDLYRMGAPFRMYLLEDVLEGRVKLPKVSLFLGCLRLDGHDRAVLQRGLRGKTAVWFYGSGYLDDRSASAENIRALTGFALSEKPEGGSAIIRFDRGHPLAAGLDETYDPALNCSPRPYDAVGADIADTFDPRIPVPADKHVPVNLAPLWAVQTAQDAAPLATYADGTVAAAVRDTGAGKSIYIGTAGCPAKLLRNILKDAGVRLIAVSDDVAAGDGRFLAFTAHTAGDKEILLPAGMRLRELLTGETFGAGDGKAKRTFKFGETALFRVEKAK